MIKSHTTGSHDTDARYLVGYCKVKVVALKVRHETKMDSDCSQKHYNKNYRHMTE